MIPFPAMTVCSTKKFTKDKIDTDDYLDTMNEIQRNPAALRNLSSKLYVKSEQIVIKKKQIFLKRLSIFRMQKKNSFISAKSWKLKKK